MKLLLDTHVLLWWLDDPNLIAEPARDAIAEPANAVLVSAAVTWEIAIKRGLGKLAAPADLLAAMELADFRMLPVTLQHALQTERLPNYHRDPFDRMLIAQAQLENATLVTRDPLMRLYSVPLLLA